MDWRSIAVFEGLASVFEDAAGVARPEWRRYEPDVIAAWTEDLFGRAVGADWMDWKFDHPDGRRNIAYKVGAWLADEAAARSGRTAADLVWESPDNVIELAGWRG